MISLFISLAVLIVGYLIYGRVTEKVFAPDGRQTPAYAKNDGVVICPITSGDTAFRSARLILGEWTGLSQKKILNRLILSVPLLAIGAGLAQIDFNNIWRYFSWSNQTLAMIALWVCTSYLVKKGKYKFGSLITAIPASFMTAVSITYIFMAPEGFRLPASVGYPIGGAVAAAAFIAYTVLFALFKKGKIGNRIGGYDTLKPLFEKDADDDMMIEN